MGPVAPHARSVSTALALVVVLALSPGCSDESSSSGTRIAAPQFDLARVGGGRVQLRDLRGKLVLLDFWATWCVPCVKEIPELNAFYRDNRARGVEVIGMTVDGLSGDELAEWVDGHGMEYPVVQADLDLATQYQAFQFPQHVLVSADGELIASLEPGYHTRDELDAAIEPYLGEVAER